LHRPLPPLPDPIRRYKGRMVRYWLKPPWSSRYLLVLPLLIQKLH
jgi:hypothetical protein